MSIWGMNKHGEVLTPTDAATDIIERAIAEHIDTRLAIAAATGLDKTAIDQVRHLHLAEPWLPACDAVKQIKAAGITFTQESR